MKKPGPLDIGPWSYRHIGGDRAASLVRL